MALNVNEVQQNKCYQSQYTLLLLDPVVSASSRHSSQLITGYAKYFHGEGQDTYFIKDQFSILLYYFIKIQNVKILHIYDLDVPKFYFYCKGLKSSISIEVDCRLIQL